MFAQHKSRSANTSTKGRNKVCPLSIVLLTVVTAQPLVTFGQSDVRRLEEIVVTAQKRAETLQDAPISVTAFTAATLDRLAVTNIANLLESAPNVTFDFTSPVSGSSNAAAVFIRGVGQQDFALTTEAGVGTYVDGVYMSRSIGGVLDVLNIERIEVLRGPQGTLFGRNTIGGAINIITAKPADSLTGDVEVALGQRDRIHVGGNVSIPVTGDVSIGLSGVHRQRDGYVRRVFSADPTTVVVDGRPGLTGNLSTQGEEDRSALRFALAADLSPKFALDLTIDYSTGDETSAANSLRGVTDSIFVGLFNATQAPAITLPGFPDANYSAENFVTGDFDTTFATGPNRSTFDAWGTALTLSWDLESSTLKSITAYRSTDAEFFRDADGSPLVFAQTLNPDYNHDQFSQELQLTGDTGNVQYAVGAYYFDEEGSDPLSALFPESFGDISISRNDVRNESWAIYGQATWNVNDQWALTAGLRYTEDRKQFATDQILTTGFASDVVFGVPPGTPIPIVPPGARSQESFDDLSPRLSVEYAWSETTNVYASYSQGFKSGGFNLRYVLPVPAVITFEPEEVDAFEVGLKWRSSNDRYQLSLAAFHSDYSDIQTTLFDDNAAPITVNAGEAEIDGLELEFAALPVDGFQLNVALGLADASYDSIRSPSAAITGDAQIVTLESELPNTPDVTAQLSAEYALPTPFPGELRARVDARYRGDTFNDAQNSPFLFQDAYTITNLALIWESDANKWQVRAFLNNATDERIIVSGDSNFALGFHEANVNRPREWGIGIKRRF